MTPYIPILCFVAGTLLGIGVTILGMYLGFKVSYDIRNAREGLVNNDGLMKVKTDPAEFELIDDSEPKREELE